MFKDKLKEERKNLGFTQEEFANKLGISRSYLGDLERGRLKGTNINIVAKLAEITGKSIEYFLDKDDDTNNIDDNQYDFLDTALEMLAFKNMIDEQGNINNPNAKKMLDDLIRQIALSKREEFINKSKEI